MIKELVKLATDLDNKGLSKEADLLDMAAKVLSEALTDEAKEELTESLEESEKSDEEEKGQDEPEKDSEGEKNQVSFSGFTTKFFHMCPGAVSSFSKLIEDESLSKKNQDTLLEAIKDTDSLLELERDVLKRESSSESDIIQSVSLVRKISNNIGELSEDIGEDIYPEFKFLDMHVEKILDEYKG